MYSYENLSSPEPSRSVLGLAIISSWMSLASYWSTHQLERSFDAGHQAHQALETLSSIRILIESAESSVRGYVISGQWGTTRGVSLRETRDPL